MTIRIVENSIFKKELEAMAEDFNGEYVKAVVDVSKGIAAFGGGLHADEEEKLLERRSRQEDLWGINIYPDRSRDEWIEFDSMINVRPSQRNRSRSVESQDIRERIIKIINELVAD